MLRAGDVDLAAVASAKILYLEGYLWDPAEPRAAMEAAIDAARAAGTKVAFTSEAANLVADDTNGKTEQLEDAGGRIDGHRRDRPHRADVDRQRLQVRWRRIQQRLGGRQRDLGVHPVLAGPLDAVLDVLADREQERVQVAAFSVLEAGRVQVGEAEPRVVERPGGEVRAAAPGVGTRACRST